VAPPWGGFSAWSGMLGSRRDHQVDPLLPTRLAAGRAAERKLSQLVGDVFAGLLEGSHSFVAVRRDLGSASSRFPGKTELTNACRSAAGVSAGRASALPGTQDPSRIAISFCQDSSAEMAV